MKIITLAELSAFENYYKVFDTERGIYTLSTAGVCYLKEKCIFNSKRYKQGYTDVPDYPLWKQPDEIKDKIITMLDSNPHGKRLIDEIITHGVMDEIRGEQ